MGSDSGPETANADNRSRRWVKLLRLGLKLGLALGLTGACLVLVPAWWKGLVPWPWRYRLERWALFLLFVFTTVILLRRPGRLLWLRITKETWARLDAVAGWLLEHRLPGALVALCLVFLLTWVPHYCTWPWWADTDQFAVSAQAWDAGILPYRDLPDFDFPGPIYLCWILGKLFGWGRTVPFNAADALLLVAFGVALAAWAKRLFGRTVPGMCAYLAFLGYYLTLTYSQTAQRDWQAPCLSALAILALEGWRGRNGRIVSALALASALAFRPQVVLFLPALASAIDENARAPGEHFSQTVRALVEWGVAFALGIVLVFSPLLIAGVADDFVRSLRVSHYGGSYNQVTWDSFRKVFLEQFEWWKLSWMVPASVVAALAAPGALRRTARTWCLALVCVLIYQPMSPITHGYLNQPRVLVWSIELAVIVQWVLEATWLVPSARLLATVVLALTALGGIPRFCTVRGSLQALGPLVRGQDPPRTPPGCAYAQELPDEGWRYTWPEYRNVLSFLRHRTSPSTRVANFLRNYPFPSFNGPAGRLPAFPAAGGVLWIWWIKPDDELRFAHALEGTPDSVVVWKPGEDTIGPRLELMRIEQVIRRLYQPRARFGKMEVWTRLPQPVQALRPPQRMPGDADFEEGPPAEARWKQ
jgi:hypothetical protein